MTNVNKELGTGSTEEIIQLVARIRGFDFENATQDENLVLIKALKTVAHDTIARFESVLDAQVELERRISNARFAEELSEVCALMRPPEPIKRPFWRNRAR